MTIGSSAHRVSTAVTVVLATVTVAAQAPVEVVRVTSKTVERQVKLPGELQP